ncbi:hypothetical protein SAMN02787118_1524 [Streptomyces mirabilis]|uniref:Uncharacterized protein n=2 Tax=Streptomyces mirabilis TaxID=68239 RepID=A0A1I2XT40_9ACTN|nr:hypothetical protein SAMN02787118_1524 [Streptomyces mirabilis]
MSPLDHPSRRAEQAGQRARTPRGRRLATATAGVCATFALALPIHPQYASASAMKTPATTAALVSSRSDLHAEPEGDRKPPHVTAPFATTTSAEARPQPQAPPTSAQDSIWGIPGPVFGGIVGAAIGVGGTAVFFTLGRRNTRKDREEDRQREDALRQRIEARDLWRDLYEDSKTATSDVLSLCIDVSMRPLCEDDAEAQQIAALLRRLRLAIERARGHRSDELTESLTRLHECLANLKAALLPARASLTDSSKIGQFDVMEIAAQSANQTRIAIELEGHVHKARDAVDTEWGSR